MKANKIAQHLTIPFELQHLIEKRDQAERRGKTRRTKAAQTVVGTGQAAAERRKKSERREKSRRKRPS